MKRFIALVGMVLVSSCCFANIPQSSQIKALANAWKTKQTTTMSSNQQLKNDLMMVYGGADISRRPTLDPRSTTA
jgi:hypothetical protein